MTIEEKIAQYEPIRQALAHEPGWRTLVVAGVEGGILSFVLLLIPVQENSKKENRGRFLIFDLNSSKEAEYSPLDN